MTSLSVTVFHGLMKMHSRHPQRGHYLFNSTEQTMKKYSVNQHLFDFIHRINNNNYYYININSAQVKVTTYAI